MNTTSTGSAASRQNSTFARAAVYSEFRARDARALDQADFVDRRPDETPHLHVEAIGGGLDDISTLPTESYRGSLDHVIRHFWHDEKEHFQECKFFNGDDTDDHVFRHLETLRRYITSN